MSRIDTRRGIPFAAAAGLAGILVTEFVARDTPVPGSFASVPGTSSVDLVATAFAAATVPLYLAMLAASRNAGGWSIVLAAASFSALVAMLLPSSAFAALAAIFLALFLSAGRCLILGRGGWSGIADAALSLTALGLALAVLARTGSYGLSAWTCFVVQSLHPMIDEYAAGRGDGPFSDLLQGDSDFDDAARRAAAAIRRLKQQRPAR